MSHNVTSPKGGVTNELNDVIQERDIRANSPAVGEEEDDGSDDDQQALLSSSSRVIRGDEAAFKPAGQQRSKNPTHVSNLLFAKGILLEVIGLSFACIFHGQFSLFRRLCQHCSLHSWVPF
jgi:hypothetical protein